MKQQRITEQKKIIYNALMQADHPTANELHEMVVKDNPTISLATVFRVLSQFAENGEIHKIQPIGNNARFDGILRPHAHMVCAECGKIKDIMSPKYSQVTSTRILDEDFIIYYTNLEFIGCCPECAKRIKKSV